PDDEGGATSRSGGWVGTGPRGDVAPPPPPPPRAPRAPWAHTYKPAPHDGHGAPPSPSPSQSHLRQTAGREVIERPRVEGRTGGRCSWHPGRAEPRSGESRRATWRAGRAPGAEAARRRAP